MYLRNVKQILRQATPSFDERAYGYGTLVDLLRAAQRDGIVRLDRDRQGVVRVFQSQQSAASASTVAAEPAAAFVVPAVSDAPVAMPDEPESVEAETRTESVPAAEPAQDEEAAPRSSSRRRRRAPASQKPRRPRKAPQE